MARSRPLQYVLVTLCMVFSLLRGAWAADAPTAALYWTDGNGTQSDRIAQHWGPRLDSAMRSGSSGVQLTPGRKDPLTTLPNLALSTPATAAHLGSPWVLVVQVGPDDAPTIHARLVDTLHPDVSYECSGLHVTAEGWKGLSDFVQQAMSEAADDERTAVVGVSSTGLYHKTDATHTSGGTPYANAWAARVAGLQPCPLCYPAAAAEGVDQTELSLSDDVARMMVKHYTLSDDKKVTERVDRVGHRLLEQNHIHDFTYTFNVLESHELNAFSAGAGHVFITTRLLALLETDDELAAVLGHEIGHCECHHVLRTFRQHQAVSLVGVMLSMATGSSMGSFVSDFLGGLFTRGFSRNFELEADYRGLLYAHVAGYNADAFVTTLRKLEQSSGHGSSEPDWLSTHPSSDNRIEEIRKEISDIADFERQIAALPASQASVAAELHSGMAQYLRQRDQVQAFLTAEASLTTASAQAP
jgi:Zn-dependent protease with chaperone function